MLVWLSKLSLNHPIMLQVCCLSMVASGIELIVVRRAMLCEDDLLFRRDYISRGSVSLPPDTIPQMQDAEHPSEDECPRGRFF